MSMELNLMTIFHRAIPIFVLAGILFLAVPATSHGPAEHKEGNHADHEGGEKLDRSLDGHEKDMPHKNRARVKEFHRLYVELGKRTGNLKAAIKADDLPRSAVAYGRILEICAACHRKFRDWEKHRFAAE